MKFVKIVFCIIVMFQLQSCKSVPEELKEKKDYLIQQAILNTPTPFSSKSFDSITDNALERLSNGIYFDKMRLNVDEVDVSYNYIINKINLDSVVVYYKKKYVAIYDFASRKRGYKNLKKKSTNLISLEEVDRDFYIGELKEKL